MAKFSKLEASDISAFMAMRRADDIASRSLMRSLAGLRSFGRFLEREGKGKVGALSAIRAPKVGKTLPKPLPMAAAKRLADADERAGETRETWVLARDAAVMALLYGSGLRISEALGLKRRDVPAPGEGDVLVVTGKGNKTRMVPVLQNVLQLIADYAAICPYALPPEGPVFVGARGGPLEPAHHPAGDGAAARRAGTARQRHAACAAALVCHASVVAWRRFACDPGTARPLLALDHADLYRHRQRAPAGSLSQRPSAKLNFTDTFPSHPFASCADAVVRQSCRYRAAEEIMSAHESMEHAEHAEHAGSENKKIALLIAVIALCLALSETLGKGAQTESIAKNVEASNLWAFFQAKTIRRTVVQTAAEQAQARHAWRRCRQGGTAEADRRLAEDRRALSLRALDP